MRNMTKFRVEVVSVDDEKVVKVSTFDNQRQAERFEDGFNINLNHEKYWTRIIEPISLQECKEG